MAKRTAFPRVFWVANLIEVLERFSYYGIYFGFGVYMTSLGYSRDQLGVVQTIFLLLSYVTPLFSGLGLTGAGQLWLNVTLLALNGVAYAVLLVRFFRERSRTKPAAPE